MLPMLNFLKKGDIIWDTKYVVLKCYNFIIPGYGVWAVSVVTFLIMFLPRSRQLVAMGKDEMFLDQDQEYCYSHQVDII